MIFLKKNEYIPQLKFARFSKTVHSSIFNAFFNQHQLLFFNHYLQHNLILQLRSQRIQPKMAINEEQSGKLGKLEQPDQLPIIDSSSDGYEDDEADEKADEEIMQSMQTPGGPNDESKPNTPLTFDILNNHMVQITAEWSKMDITARNIYVALYAELDRIKKERYKLKMHKYDTLGMKQKIYDAFSHI